MNPQHSPRTAALALAATAALLTLAGCASSTDPQGTPKKSGTDAVVQVHEDKATGIKTLAFAPQPLDCGRRSDCPTLGARWSSATPNRAELLVGFVGQNPPSVDGVDFVLRGQSPLRVRSKAPGAAVPGVTTFQVPMNTLERIAFAKAAAMQVQLSTQDGMKTLEEDLSSGSGNSPADVALKRLMVEAYKGTDKEEQLGLKSLFGTPYQR